MPNEHFDYHLGAEDPATVVRRAHESAAALLARTRASDDELVMQRILDHTDEHGLDLVAQLWASVDARSLPGALWRLYLLRAAILEDATAAGTAFTRGAESLATIDPVVAGASTPTGPEEILALADEIFRGAFRGELADALDRAAAYCRVSAAGWLQLADAREFADHEHATALTTRAARLTSMAEELADCARLDRRAALA